MKSQPLSIAGTVIKPGERKVLELPAASLYTQTPINIPVHVIHGRKNGPCIFLVAALHGDELNGVEVIRQLLNHSRLKHLHGTLIALPIANVHGFITLSRYLPDRRDLNRSFPGSKSGSLAARIAELIMREFVSNCTHVIDLHTGRMHLENLPHIRTNIDMTGAIDMAKAFNVPVIVDAKLRDGSLRQAAMEMNIPTVVYEGGEALRLSNLAIRVGVRGILNVMRTLGMIATAKPKKHELIIPRVADAAAWVRSPESGIIQPLKSLGHYVEKGDILGVIVNPFSKKECVITASFAGIIIGKNNLPLVNEGDALFHLAKFKNGEEVTSEFNQLEDYLIENPLAYF